MITISFNIWHGLYIAIHDYQRTSCGGATEAVDRWLRRSHRRVVRADSLLVAYA